jgi:hypothetical protein
VIPSPLSTILATPLVPPPHLRTASPPSLNSPSTPDSPHTDTNTVPSPQVAPFIPQRLNPLPQPKVRPHTKISNSIPSTVVPSSTIINSTTTTKATVTTTTTRGRKKTPIAATKVATDGSVIVKTRKQRQTLACQICFNHKVKCDGLEPSLPLLPPICVDY